MQQRGEHAAAIRIYRWFLTREPDNARVLQIYGIALMQIGDLDGAVRVLSRSIASDPHDSSTHGNLASALYQQGRLHEAVAAFDAAIEVDASATDAHNDRGNALRDLGRTDAAIESYRRAIATDGALATPHFNLGNVLWDCDRIDEAVMSYRAAIAIDPGLAPAHNNLGNAYRSGNDLAGAVDCYAAAASCDPSFALAWFNLANTLKDLGRDDEALQAYRRVLALDPGNGPARYMTAALAGEPVTAAPEAFIRDVFDSYAGHFDSHLAGALAYDVPKALRDAVLGADPAPPSDERECFAHVLDLGCGTGLAGEAFAPWVTRIDGVDLSTRMLMEARRKGIYDTLIEGEMVAHLDVASLGGQRYDAVLAADSFIYCGDLGPVFAGVARCLEADGVFAFSVEAGEGEPFALRRTGRFAHGDGYIRTLADANGFRVRSMATAVVRVENEVPVNGALWVLNRAPC
jgi:predicted TPR repeat methyltransferase